MTVLIPVAGTWMTIDIFLRLGAVPDSPDAADAAEQLRHVARPWRWGSRALGVLAWGAQIAWLGLPVWSWPLALALDVGVGELLWRAGLRKQFPHLQ